MLSFLEGSHYVELTLKEWEVMLHNNYLEYLCIRGLSVLLHVYSQSFIYVSRE